jgi:hypothetical protein
MRYRIAVFALAGLAGCGDSPVEPDPTPNVQVLSYSPSAAGAEVVVPRTYPYILPGGVVLPRTDSLVRLDVSARAGRRVPFARLNVFLLTGGTATDYCGANDPDAPTWTDITEDWSVRVQISGFRVSRLPCQVTGFRVVLHTRNDGRLGPPTPDFVVAEIVVPARFTLRREE